MYGHTCTVFRNARGTSPWPKCILWSYQKSGQLSPSHCCHSQFQPWKEATCTTPREGTRISLHYHISRMVKWRIHRTVCACVRPHVSARVCLCKWKNLLCPNLTWHCLFLSLVESYGSSAYSKYPL